MSSTKNEIRHDLTGQASWLYWIAGLTLVNVVTAVINLSFGFAAGLVFVDYLIAIFQGLPGLSIVGFLASAAVIGLFAFMGYVACRGARWAFLVGAILMTLDTWLYLPALDQAQSLIIGIAIHIWAAVSLFNGFIASGKPEQTPNYVLPGQGNAGFDIGTPAHPSDSDDGSGTSSR